MWPKQKEPEFDMEGRPHHPFFYTTMPHFTQATYDIVDTLENCLLLTDRMYGQVSVTRHTF